MPELRRDLLTGTWVIVAEKRSGRPRDFKPGTQPSEDREECPFEPGREERTPTEVDAIRPESGTGWTVRVVPNKYNALSPAARDPAADGELFVRRPARGHHEVVVETPEHDRHLADFTPEQVKPVLNMFDRRLRDLRSRPGVRHVQIFRNEGREAGASLRHPHSQIMALPFQPASVLNRHRHSSGYYSREGECLLCAIIREEENRGERVVRADAECLVLAPFASTYPYETWILPRSHRSDLTDLSGPQKSAVGHGLTDTARRLRSVLDNPSTNVLVHGTPSTDPDPDLPGNPGEHVHFLVRLIPRLKHAAGLELSTGTYINPVPPERAASRLRGAP